MENNENDKTIERLNKLEENVEELLGSIDGAARLQCSGLMEYLDRIVSGSPETIYVASLDKLAGSQGRLEALQAFAKEAGFKIEEIFNPEQEQA